MPSYATIEDLIAAIPRGEQELIELTDRTGSGEIDSVKVERALETATNLINTYVAKVATLPLSVVPPTLRDHCANIARYQLYGDAPHEEIRKRYEQAIAWLRDLVAGKADLGVPQDEAPTPVARASRGEIRSGIDWSNYP